ncbi:MAG: LuxR family transcriptional regulator, maltose regulon positive regulatory protein [Actinoplanes sp.]|jgi:hypothetical protein|nr:LuxR family transcriptional regulator, maltose regulon positive regulatory protein [Actinoplanes sp.]
MLPRSFRNVVEAHLLDALACQNLDDPRAARAAVEQALHLAEPHRLILPFALTGACPSPSRRCTGGKVGTIASVQENRPTNAVRMAEPRLSRIAKTTSSRCALCLASAPANASATVAGSLRKTPQPHAPSTRRR